MPSWPRLPEPIPHREPSVEKERVGAAGGDGNHAGGDLDGGEAVGGGTIAKLAVVVGPHRPEGAVGFDEQGVDTAGGDGGDAGGDLNRG